MNRRKFSKNLSIASVFPFIPCIPDIPGDKTTMIVHHVFFWLNNPTDATKLLQGLKKLGTIPQVKQLLIGQPANTEKREVVDNSYHVSELMYFESFAAQKEYQDHPVHKQFVADYSHLFEKVVVYDTLMEIVSSS